MLAALRSADLSPGDWLTPGDLALILRSAYDPAVAGALERHGDVGRDLATAGPVAVTESWGSLAQRLRAPLRALDQRVAALPRLPRLPRAPAPVLRDPADLHAALHADAHRPRGPRHPQEEDRVHLRRRPAPEDRPDRGRPADGGVPGRPPAGGRPHRRPRRAPGTGFVAVSASDPDELERAVAAIEQAAIQASCETRRLWGQQAQGFAAAALPLARPI